MIRSTWAIPLLLTVMSLVGLVLALTGDGWRDLASWVLLAVPVLAVLWATRAQRS